MSLRRMKPRREDGFCGQIRSRSIPMNGEKALESLSGTFASLSAISGLTRLKASGPNQVYRPELRESHDSLPEAMRCFGGTGC